MATATLPRTRVVSARDYASDADMPPDAVYVGRAMPRHRLALVRRRSPFANPHLSMREYRHHVLSRPDLLALLPGLRGKVLVCWCAGAAPASRGTAATPPTSAAVMRRCWRTS